MAIGLKEGGRYKSATGHLIEIPPHSCREYLEVWANGACVEILVYREPREGHDENDRIQVMITDASGHRSGWMMNGEDAVSLICGLATALRILLDEEISMTPLQNRPMRGANHS